MTPTPTTFIPHPPEWIPHQRETWPTRYADLAVPVELRVWNGGPPDSEASWKVVPLPAGATVKIVMVSRMGDVGITNKLDANVGYHARVGMESLTNLRSEP